MAVLALTAAVSAFSGYTGFALFAAQLAATAVGSFIDSRLFARNTHLESQGPRIQSLSMTASSEGANLNRMYGRCRMGGQVIWASRFEEEVVTTTTSQGGGGKGIGGGGSVSSTQTTYNYFLSFAVAFCEGNAQASLGQVWADGKLLELSNLTYRFYPGTTTQSPDSYIQSVEGSAYVPAYRGVAYVVFERMPLQDFGNRMPQVTAEIIKPIISTDPNKLENCVNAITLIPASGEFIYATQSYVQDDGFGNAKSENIHRQRDRTDLQVSLDDLQKQLPNVTSVNLVVAWFGDDLRAGSSTIRPKVELSTKIVYPTDWLVNGVNRAAALQVSQDGQGRPIFGGTPSDQTIVECVNEIKSRGLKVFFYPFLLMDIPSGNGKTDPYGGVEQAAFPWRGLITCSPAIGQGGTVDKTATAATQINAFFGSVTTGNFNIAGTVVNYTGSGSDWGYRRMVLHYANLMKAASVAGSYTVDGFLIGTELRGITTPRSNNTSTPTFPGVDALVTLAADVQTVFGVLTTKVSYAADWSEYHSYRPGDGTGDVFFNMDPLWSSANIDFIGIDNYFPISDWRDGTAHLDYNAVTGPTKIYDKTYLASQVEGGEYYTYFYANQAARDSQTRTAITDVTYGKPWVFRQKDIRNWWTNTHKNRPLGVEAVGTTSWVAQGKPIYFTESGCAAVDKATNEPNVFFDPKSSQSALPFYSSGRRDDLIQRMFHEVVIAYWRDNSPTSGVYGDKMLRQDSIFAWTWDARPYPAFPLRPDIWTDSDNYAFGHWLNGRVGQSSLAELVKEICAFVGFTSADIDVSDLLGTNTLVEGYIIDSLMSPRDALNPLQEAFLFDSFENNGKLTFTLRIDSTFTTVDINDLVIEGKNQGYALTRTQESELPLATQLTFIDKGNQYQQGSATGLKLVGASKNIVSLQFPIVLDQAYVRALADVIIQESWAAREQAELSLPISYMKFNPGDGIKITISGRDMYIRLNKVTIGQFLKLEAAGFEPSIYDVVDFTGKGSTALDIPVYGKAVVRFLDIPLITGQEERPWAPRLAGYMSPMSSSIIVDRILTSGTLEQLGTIPSPCVIGRTANLVYSATPSVWDDGNSIVVDIFDPNAQLASATETDILNGLTNALAIQNTNGEWEILQFVNAALNSPGRYTLTHLLRGQLGTEPLMQDPYPVASPVVFLDTNLLATLLLPTDQKLGTYNYKYGAAELDPAGPFWQTEAHTFTAAGLLPYAPTQLTLQRLSGNDLTISWTRRTRFNGDNWEPPDVPLNEENERYDLEIYNGLTLVRSVLGLTSPTYTYVSANQVTDFGSNQTSLKVRVYQLSTAVGRGRKAEKTLFI